MRRSEGKQRGLADGSKRRGGEFLRGAQGGGRGQGVAVDEKAGEGDIHLPTFLVIRRVLGAARVGLHQHAGHAQVCAVAMGQAWVAVRAVGERLDMVALGIKALHGGLLQVHLGLAQRCVTSAVDFQTIGIVLVAAVPVVGIHDQGGAQSRQQAGHGACFGLGERPPVAVQVGPRVVQARA